MSKNHDCGLQDWIVWLWPRDDLRECRRRLREDDEDDDFFVPLSAADRLRAGDGVAPREKEGRCSRLLLGFKKLERWRVGDRPAAAVAGADEGVVLDGLVT